jgi:uncharacterized membrane protein YedE/YeeE
MANFTPLSAAIGGGLIGLAAALLMLTTGRIAGISGIFGGLIGWNVPDRDWRIAFIVGLILRCWRSPDWSAAMNQVRPAASPQRGERSC